MLLDDLSWSIGPGMRIGIVGVNGSGKTTVLRLLHGDLAPDSGRIKRGQDAAYRLLESGRDRAARHRTSPRIGRSATAAGEAFHGRRESAPARCWRTSGSPGTG